MADAGRFTIGGNDEHGLNPPTAGKRTPTMPYINRSFYENEFNRPAKYYFLIACLRTGFDIFDVKPEWNDIAVSERVRRVNSNRLNALVTFAYNAAGNDAVFSSANGHQVFYSRENRYAAESRLLAYDVSAGLTAETGTADRGVSTLIGIGMIRSVNCPSVIAECGFMTNFEEAKLMVDPDFQRSCGDGACRGVCEHFDVDYITSVDYTSLPTLRRGNRGNAVQLLQCYLNLYGNALSVDGVFGQNTQSAVERFQRENGLTQDGIVGKNTWQTLLMQKPLPLLKQGDRKSVV